MKNSKNRKGKEKKLRFDKKGNLIKKGNKFKISFYPTVDIHHVENWKHHNVPDEDWDALYNSGSCCKLCRLF